MNQWISVDERLPSSNGDVLVWAVSHDPEVPPCHGIDYFDGQEWEWGSVANCKITHWMPLPEAPK